MINDERQALKRKRRNLWLMGGLFVWAIWATLPPGDLALDSECRPEGGPASVSAAIYGSWFWHRQLNAGLAEANRLAALPAQRMAQEEEERKKVDDRMNHLNKGDIRNAERDERQRREELEQRHRLFRLAWLAQCQAEIERHLE